MHEMVSLSHIKREKLTESKNVHVLTMGGGQILDTIASRGKLESPFQSESIQGSFSSTQSFGT